MVLILAFLDFSFNKLKFFFCFLSSEFFRPHFGDPSIMLLFFEKLFLFYFLRRFCQFNSDCMQSLPLFCLSLFRFCNFCQLILDNRDQTKTAVVTIFSAL